MMEIRPLNLTPETIMNLRPFLESVSRRPLPHLPEAIVGNAAEVRTEQLRQAAGEAGASFFIGQDDRGIKGLAVTADLPWDSEILGVKCAVVKEILVADTLAIEDEPVRGLLDALMRHFERQSVRFVLCKTDTDNVGLIHALERAGFGLMDTLLEYGYDFARPPFAAVVQPAADKDFLIRPASPDDREQLVNITDRAFAKHFGRFHVDPAIPTEKALEVYRRWADSACKGYCDWIWVAQAGERIAGFTAWKKRSVLEQRFDMSVAHYNIGVIDPDFFGRGLFQVLTYEGMKELGKEGYLYIDGPTHVNNYPVQRGLANLGWKICNARHAFHKWL